MAQSRRTKGAPKRDAPGPDKPGQQIVVRVQDQLLAAIDEWCADQLDQPTRAEALRRLAAMALAAKRK
jgi:hypothetical protein